MNQPVKRRNPFESAIKPQEEVEVKNEENVVEEPTIIEEKQPEVVVEEQEIYEEPVKQIVKTVKPTVKTKPIQPEEEVREKYTSTMEVTLRRRIKIVCATRGIMFSEFIEEACKEKLRREGER